MGKKPAAKSRVGDAPLHELGRDELSVFLYVAFTGKELLKVLKDLGVEYPGHRLESFGDAARADLFADEVRAAEDAREAALEMLHRYYGAPAFPKTELSEEMATELTQLAVREDAVVRILWRLLADPSPKIRDFAVPALQALVKLFYGPAEPEPVAVEKDPAGGGNGDGEADGDAEREPAGDAPALVAGEDREIARTRRELERAEQTVKRVKERESEAKADLKSVRAELSETKKALAAVIGERNTLAASLAKTEAALEAARAAGGGSGVSRATNRLEAAEDRLRTITAERDALRKERDALRTQLDAAHAKTASAPAAAPEDEEEALEEVPATWSNPRFTKEFYDSLQKWDARLQRFAFKKAFLLAENHRHPSLRAIQLEGVPGLYRVRVASDVRMIYRRTEDGGVEILSVIDREDLDRYIRQAKTR